MTAIDLERFRERLLRMRRNLVSVGEKAEAGTRTVELDQARMGRLTRADALQSQAMSLEAKRRRSVELRQVDAALRRIESGDFGICSRCDEEIGARRLEVSPTAVLCIDCASRGERRT